MTITKKLRRIKMFFNEEHLKIALLVQRGRKNIEIGEELGYSAESIKKRLGEIYKKLGVKRRVELVNFLSKNNLFST